MGKQKRSDLDAPLRIVSGQMQCLRLVSAAGATSTTASAATSSASATTTSASSAAAGAASTFSMALEIRIADHKAASHQAFHVVNSRAIEQRRTIGVHQYLDGGSVDDEIVIASFFLDTQHILDSALGAGHDHDSEHTVLAALIFKDVLEFFCSQITDL